MKSILLFLISLLIINTVYAQWSIKHLNEDSENTGTIKFRNDSVGIFMGGYSTCLKTTDAGETWVKKSFNINGDLTVFDFQFVGDSSVIATGVYSNTKILSSELIKSDDLGEHWYKISNFMEEYLQSVWFFNIDTGIIAGGEGIYKTIDAGNTWDTVWSISNNYKYGEVKQLYFPTNETGYAIGIGRNQHNEPLFDNYLLKSYDSGAKWDTVKTFFHAELTSLYFINQDTGFVGTNNGKILKTTDGGYNWEVMQISEWCEIRSIQFISEMKGFAVGGEEWIFVTGENELSSNGAGGYFNFIISKTIDGGETWVSYDTIGVDLSSVYFINDSVGFVSGRYELIMKSNGKEINQLPEDYPWHLIRAGGSGVAENNQITSDINVFPNPVPETLTIQFKSPGKKVRSVSLVNSTGQTIEYQSPISNSHSIKFNMLGYPQGMYLIKVEFDDKTEIAKIIKQ